MNRVVGTTILKSYYAKWECQKGNIKMHQVQMAYKNRSAYISEKNEMLEARIKMRLFLEADNLLKM